MMDKYRSYNSDIKNEILNNKDCLSLREREICDLILSGLSNQDIAQKLFITEGTVKSHINRIYKKLGVKKRIEVINKYN